MTESRREKTMISLKELKLGAVRRMYDEILDRNLKAGRDRRNSSVSCSIRRLQHGRFRRSITGS